METKQDERGKWQLADRFAKFEVAEIAYDGNRKINRLRIVNSKTGASVYEFGMTARQKKTDKEPKADAKGEVTKVNTIPSTYDVKTAFNTFCNEHKIVATQFTEWRDKAASESEKTGVVAKEFKKMTTEEWVELFTRLGVLAEQGYFDE